MGFFIYPFCKSLTMKVSLETPIRVVWPMQDLDLFGVFMDVLTRGSSCVQKPFFILFFQSVTKSGTSLRFSQKLV